MPFSTYNIHDMLEEGGKEGVSELLRHFSCPLNYEIERFVAENAIDFALRKISVTYFVFNSLNEITGFFTLTHKPSFISLNALGSMTMRKRLERFCGGLRVDDRLLGSAFLIAQFGKNMDDLRGETISGNELMDCAFEVLTDVQRKIGGGIVFLECEDNGKLLDFYQNDHNKLMMYGVRHDDVSNMKYLQLLRIF